MDSQKTRTVLQPDRWHSELVQFLRWLIGGVIGFGLSAWICYGYMTNTATGAPSWILDSLPSILIGTPLMLFHPSFLGNDNLIDYLVRAFPNISRDFIVISVPSVIWGCIGALLASGSKGQIKTGVILLVLYLLLGFYALFRVVRMVPT